MTTIAQSTQIESAYVCAECGLPECDGCASESEPWTWDADTIADVKYHELHEDGLI